MTNQTCQTCNKEFVIRDEDLVFYEKMKVPPPTFCPDCRLQQRTAWRNEKSLYRRKCDLCQKQIISIYSNDKSYKVYCRECYHGDKWDPLSFGKEIDFSKPFLKQYHELLLKVPRILSFIFQNIDSEYVNGAAFNKNCYMIFVSDHNEDCLYSYNTYFSKSSSDLLTSFECDLSYESISCSKCYKTYYSEDCSNCQDIFFCKNCVNCSNCIGCANLRNVKYAIFNQVYNKEEYFKKLEELKLNNRSGVKNFEKAFKEFHIKFPVKYYHGIKNVNVMGDDITNSKNSSYVFDSEELEDCKFINYGNRAKDSHDSYVIVERSERVFGVLSGINLNNVLIGNSIWNGYNIFYSDTCENSNNLFGCVGLKKKEYCILNKQYTKEKYQELVPKIIEHMTKTPYKGADNINYVYGDFFPKSFSPFAYNETVAQQYFPLTKETSTQKGFQWQNEEQKNYKTTLEFKNLPETIGEIRDNITQEIIGCSHNGKCQHGCTTALKLTQMEIDLYRRLNVPVPELCFNCRHGERISKRNHKKLYSRKCMKEGCNNEFETTYAPDRPEIIYCEKCYQQEIY